jgi:flavin reductase (DIM6/NTAB) family NADH-FMN oxidoreductase RutF
VFKEINITNLEDLNPISKISKEWMLITAGDQEKYNTMTASWGNLGYIWNKPVATMYIRQTRYTKEFADKFDYFSLCFFEKKYRKDLGYLGTYSGRDEDKVAKTSLTVDFFEDVPYFKEASLVLICKKEYSQDMKPECFHDKECLKNNYENDLLHKLYIGEIVHTFINK